MKTFIRPTVGKFTRRGFPKKSPEMGGSFMTFLGRGLLRPLCLLSASASNLKQCSRSSLADGCLHQSAIVICPFFCLNCDGINKTKMCKKSLGPSDGILWPDCQHIFLVYDCVHMTLERFRLLPQGPDTPGANLPGQKIGLLLKPIEDYETVHTDSKYLRSEKVAIIYSLMCQNNRTRKSESQTSD